MVADISKNEAATELIGEEAVEMDLVGKFDEPTVPIGFYTQTVLIDTIELRRDLFSDGEIEAKLSNIDEVGSELLNHYDIEQEYWDIDANNRFEAHAIECDLEEKNKIEVVKDVKENDQIVNIEKD